MRDVKGMLLRELITKDTHEIRKTKNEGRGSQRAAALLMGYRQNPIGRHWRRCAISA
jgi:hypothetical protein